MARSVWMLEVSTAGGRGWHAVVGAPDRRPLLRTMRQWREDAAACARKECYRVVRYVPAKGGADGR